MIVNALLVGPELEKLQEKENKRKEPSASRHLRGLLGVCRFFLSDLHLVVHNKGFTHV